MNNCGCDHGAGIVPATLCCKQKPAEPPVKLATINYPAQYGTDAEGQPYAPQYGKFTNTVVTYAANNARYIYDGQGEYTKIISDDQFNALEAKLTAQITEETANRTEADNNLQTNINQLADKEAEDVENLQTNINTEVNRATEAEQALNTAIEAEATAREEADAALNTRIDEVINSPDVRYIVESYADLEAIDKATVGDQDYARVLVDETHDGQSTFYQFSKANNDWSYIGAAGAYYTKTEVDSMLADKQNTLVSGTNIKTVNGESLLGAGDVAINGGSPIFNTYADLQNADTTDLKTGDEAIVLQDETHDNLLSVYKYTGGSTIPASATRVSWTSLASAGSLSAKYEVQGDGSMFFANSLSTAISPTAIVTANNSGGPADASYPIALYAYGSLLTSDGVTIGVRQTVGTNTGGLTLRTRGATETSFNDLPITSGYNYVYVAPSTDYDRAWLYMPQGSSVTNGDTFEFIAYVGNVVPTPWEYVGSTTEAGGADVDQATATTAGIMKLYTDYGTNTDGTVTQSFLNTQLRGRGLTLGGNAKSTNVAVAIGQNSGNSTALASVSLGAESNASGDYGVALGYNATTTHEYGVALGRNAKTTRDDELSIGNTGTLYPKTRYIANVKAGTLPTDAVNLKQMQDYVAEHAGGGGSATLYNEWGTNTDGSLTQNFLNSKLRGTSLALGSDNNSTAYGTISMGIMANAATNNAISIGTAAGAHSAGSIAIGGSASVSSVYASSVAIGSGARANRSKEVSFGYIYADESGTKTRFLANVTAGELDTDAVNVAQLNAAVGDIETALTTLNTGAGV